MDVLAVSGYKPHELGIFKQDAKEIHYIKKTIEGKLISFIEEGLTWVVISGQPGVELWAGEVVSELKREYSHIKLAILAPFYNQEQIWNEHQQEQYQLLLEEADFVDVISKKEYEGPAQLKAKNDFIITKTDGLLLLYHEEQPGTPSFYLKAAEIKAAHKEYPIYLITPDDLQQTVEEEDERLRDYWE